MLDPRRAGLVGHSYTSWKTDLVFSHPQVNEIRAHPKMRTPAYLYSLFLNLTTTQNHFADLANSLSKRLHDAAVLIPAGALAQNFRRP
jgi:hypothetical protein